MRPINALSPAPFLVKMYDIVDDPAMDGVVCWGSRGQSFVVLDTVEFSRSVLPSHFKHNNFSSFVRQLNTYGFRKTGIDRWEFANEDFQQGKKHLLKNIRRRRSSAQVVAQTAGCSSSVAMTRTGLEDEVEMLRKDKELMKNEVLQLQEEHRMTAQHMDSVKLKIQSAEQRQSQMVRFLSKLLHNSVHVHGKEQKKNIFCSAPKKAVNYVELPSKLQFDTAGTSCYVHENMMDGFESREEDEMVLGCEEVGVKSSSGGNGMHVESSPIGFAHATDVVSWVDADCFISFPDQDNNITPVVTESIPTMPKETLAVPASESQLWFGGPLVYDQQEQMAESSPLLDLWFQQDVETPNFNDYYLGSDVLCSKEFGSKGKSPRK